MPFGSVQLIPGVNTERTPTTLQSGVSQSQLIRYKDSLVQKYGGWVKYYSNAVGGVPRDLLAWQDLGGQDRVLIGTTTALLLLSDGTLTPITPQEFESDTAVNFTTIMGSAEVEIVDTNISNVTTFDSVMIRTPVSVGGLVLSGLYQITTITGVTSYKITASSNATSGETNAGSVPTFTTTSGSATVSTELVTHGLAAGDRVVFQVSTTGNGVTVFGHYSVATVTDADNFTFVAAQQATANGSFDMNGGLANFLYYIALGPPPLGAGYGLGGYGEGGFGTGTTGGNQTGTPITATDWTSTNWGEIALACPYGGGVYQYDPSGGFTNAQLVATAPPFNGGIFVANNLQILFCWGSSEILASGQPQPVGVERSPLLVSWSGQGDYTQFQPSTTNQAGNFLISSGSVIRGGMSIANTNLFWTDLDLWQASYAGFPLVFGFVKIGAGAGAIASHAMQQFRGGVYWMGQTNFYAYTGDGVKVLPCPVWDAVFQNLNTAYSQNVRAMPNTPFNEVGWLYPSSASTSGECDSYVKMNVTEPNAPWDYGTMARSAWIDQTIIGMPLGASPQGIIYQQETTPDADNSPLMASFTTGYFYIAEGEDYAFVDQILPDMKWATFGSTASATVLMSFNIVNFPGDDPTVYGPYPVISTTETIPVRMRGRQMSITVASNDIGSFWRLGKVRYRYSATGRH